MLVLFVITKKKKTICHLKQIKRKIKDHLVDTGKVKIEAPSYLKFMVKHSKKLILGIKKRDGKSSRLLPYQTY